MKRVHIVAVQSDLEVQALRASCEYWGAEVSVTWAGNANQIVDFFSSSPTHDIIILAGHGDEDGLCLPEITANYKDQTKIHPEDFAEFLRRKANILLNTSCCGGTPAMTRTFLTARAKAYIAHPDYPDGSEALLVSLRFLYPVLTQESPLAECLPPPPANAGFELHTPST